MRIQMNGDWEFDLKTSTIEEISEHIARVYEPVRLAESPMFRWIQILNDVTILGEEVRRDRPHEAVDRAGRVLMRVLHFVGHYLYVYQSDSSNARFGDLVSRALKAESYTTYFGSSGPQEGPTRWILAKYPYYCAKCGDNPCECSVHPWVFEERREKPGPFTVYRNRIEEHRNNLSTGNIKLFTLPSLCKFFNDIYRNTYYNQDSWKLVMHLVEELGEVTQELSTIYLIWLGQQQGFDLGSIVDKVLSQAKTKIEQDTGRIRHKRQKVNIKNRALRELEELIRSLDGDAGWNIILGHVSERLKEETADIFSWLAAIIYALTGGKVISGLGDMINRYVKVKGYMKVLRCAWCGEETCDDSCLVNHAITEELVEKVLRW